MNSPTDTTAGADTNPARTTTATPTPREGLPWQGPALFLLAVMVLAWLFLPGGPRWIRPADERWQHGIQAAREMWQLTRVYRELHEGTLPGVYPGSIGDNAETLNWDMPYFEERLRWFAPDDFQFVEVDPAAGTFRIRLVGSLPDSPPGTYMIDQDAQEHLEVPPPGEPQR